MRILPRSDIDQRLPRSRPASEHVIPNAVMNIPSILIKFIKPRERLILFAAISEKLIMPIRHVKAKRQKANVSRKATTELKLVPGVSSLADARNFGSLSIAIHASESLPVQR